MILERLKKDLITAMKEKDTVKKGLLQLVITSINNTSKEKKVELSEAEEIALVQRELKQTKEALEMFKNGNRADLVKESEYKIQILETYLPKQLNESEITEMVKGIIAELNMVNPTVREKGLIMKALMPKVKGQADGKLVDSVVSSFLK